MNLLTVDTAAVPAGVCISRDGIIRAHIQTQNGYTHSKNLMPMLDTALFMAEMTLREIDTFAVVVGPGSFTGVRIGVATIKTLAHVQGKPCIAVHALDALAWNLPYCNGTIATIMDARKGQVYGGLYRWELDAPVRIITPDALPIEQLCEMIPDGQAVFVGGGVPPNREAIVNLMEGRAGFAPSHLLYENALSAAREATRLWESGKTLTHEEIMPLYLRDSQAERQRKHNMEREHAHDG